MGNINLGNILAQAEKNVPGTIEAAVKPVAQEAVDDLLPTAKGLLLNSLKQEVTKVAGNNAVEADVLNAFLAALEKPILDWEIKL